MCTELWFVCHKLSAAIKFALLCRTYLLLGVIQHVSLRFEWSYQVKTWLFKVKTPP